MASNETRATGRTSPTAAPAPREIVVALDDSPSAAAALRAAVEQARTRAQPLRVVHAWRMTAPDAAAAAAGTVEVRAAAGADARARATRRVLDALGAGAADVHWSLDIVEGPPSPLL